MPVNESMSDLSKVGHFLFVYVCIRIIKYVFIKYVFIKYVFSDLKAVFVKAKEING